MTGNDVIDYAKYYHRKDEPPRFYNEYFETKSKLFIPIDDISLGQRLCKNTKDNAILHYFVKDTKQNKLIKNFNADIKLHMHFYAVCSPDFSVDSENCYPCFNYSNILKSRIIASYWQNKLGLRVILTLIWGEKDTYKYAFSNIEKGNIVAISHQGIKNENVFKNAFLYAIDNIQPAIICWYGKLPDYVKHNYDIDKIVVMQTRTNLIKLNNKIEQKKEQFSYTLPCA